MSRIGVLDRCSPCRLKSLSQSEGAHGSRRRGASSSWPESPHHLSIWQCRQETPGWIRAVLLKTVAPPGPRPVRQLLLQHMAVPGNAKRPPRRGRTPSLPRPNNPTRRGDSGHGVGAESVFGARTVVCSPGAAAPGEAGVAVACTEPCVFIPAWMAYSCCCRNSCCC